MNLEDGFFKAAPLAPAVDARSEDIDLFAQAIAGRFNNPEKALLTARLSPTSDPRPSTPPQKSTLHLTPNPSPSTHLASMSIGGRSRSPHQPFAAASSSSEFTVATASTLPDILRTPHVLVLDIRPHSAYSTYRLPHAISLSVPSTLLKRPAFTLQKLTAMLPSASARARFTSWDRASRILVYDADSSALTDGSNLLGLLRKFRTAGFSGDVAWLQGGIQSLWRDHRHIVDNNALSEDEEEGETSEQVLRARNLPQAAFQQSSTAFRASPTMMSMQSEPCAKPQGSAQSPSASTLKLAAANPFYDNIRQNLELSQGMTERIPLHLSPTVASRAKELPFAWLRNIAAIAGQDESTEALAMQFYRIELGEQRRLQGVMAHHSNQSDGLDNSKPVDATCESRNEARPFPYSIIAGFEKGTKNRYKNIWPFEHSRVRLHGQEQDDDYVNASFVQPIGTRRRYIATQGPLPSTFSDFWSVVWEQNVKIILMLSRQCEGGVVKCGKYWVDGQYGPIHIKCITRSGAADEDPGGGNADGSTGGFFSAPSKDNSALFTPEDKVHNFTIRRLFEISHADHPELKPRVVKHVQYLGWPDMDVPVNPKSLLRLMFEVDDLLDQTDAQSDVPDKPSPVLLHCSAGVGRTGAFIMIDAVLDGIRREIRKRAMARRLVSATEIVSGDRSSGSEGEAHIDGASPMDVDSLSSVRERSFASPARVPTPEPSFPSKSNILPPTSQVSSVSKAPSTSMDNQIQSGPTATLHMGGDRSGHHEIHVPLVPSDEVPAQARAQAYRDPKNAPAQRLNSPSANPASQGRPARHIIRHRPLTSDFTIADADSMFMSSNPDPQFAMDVESLQPSFQRAVNNNSSSGEGNGSGGDRNSESISSGSASDGRFTGPLRKAFASLSSTDDSPDSPERPSAVRFRHRFGGSGGAGSGESAGGSTSESSTKRSNGSGSGNNGGGYTSSSSLGLGGFAGMAVGSPAPDSRHTSPVPRPSLPLANRGRHRSPRNLPMQKPSLLAPKPLHLKLQMPELTEGVETTIQSAPGTLPTFGEPSNIPGRSGMSSTSSYASTSTDTSSSLRSTSLSGNTTDDTPVSMHKDSRSPSADKDRGMKLDLSVIDYTEPRELNDDDSPPVLSSLEEPLRQILEDMRKQRMSLCQSLRQYVFVHTAIIEGALVVAEEERKRMGVDSKDLFDRDSPTAQDAMHMLQAITTTIQTTGKRGASPTELAKEDKKGNEALAKRPSVKRGKSESESQLSVSPV